MPKARNPVLLILRFASSYNSLSSIQISLSSGREGTMGVLGEDVGRKMRTRAGNECD
jgi:hypothetical protein